MVENNNALTKFQQIWPQYVFLEEVPDTPPTLADAGKTTTGKNPDGSAYIKYEFYLGSSDKSDARPTLTYYENLQLKKEFRQSHYFIFPNEEDIRKVILPNIHSNRNYTPRIYCEAGEIAQTQVQPVMDYETCRLSLKGLEVETVKLDCWLYTGHTLDELGVPPFSDTIWLIQNSKGERASFSVSEQKSYILPPTVLTQVEKDGTLVTHETINTVINNIGEIDGGECW